MREVSVGWTLYAPLSVQQPNPRVDLMLLGLHLGWLGHDGRD